MTLLEKLTETRELVDKHVAERRAERDTATQAALLPFVRKMAADLRAKVESGVINGATPVSYLLRNTPEIADSPGCRYSLTDVEARALDAALGDIDIEVYMHIHDRLKVEVRGSCPSLAVDLPAEELSPLKWITKPTLAVVRTSARIEVLCGPDGAMLLRADKHVTVDEADAARLAAREVFDARTKPSLSDVNALRELSGCADRKAVRHALVMADGDLDAAAEALSKRGLA